MPSATCNEPVSKLLDLVLAVLKIVLCDLVVLLHCLELFHSVTSYRTDSDLALLAHFLDVLNKLLTSVLSELWESKSDNRAVVLWIDADIRSLDSLFDRLES